MYNIYVNNLTWRHGHVKQLLLIMKLTTLFTLIAIMQVSANALAQRVTLSARNASIETIIDRVSQQTGFDFVFNREVLDAARPVSVSLSDVELEVALSRIFHDQPLNYTVREQTVIISKRATSNSARTAADPNLILAYVTITGKITDSLGNSLEGASIRVLNAEGKRTALQTKTDREGYFMLNNVPEDAQLEITYVGYVTRIIRATVAIGQVMLQELSNELEEVMVNTGYQTLPKERATGSFAHINNELYNRNPNPNIIKRLEGVTNGLFFDMPFTQESPSEEPTLRVRGPSTINGPSNPLIVVDNFPYEGDIRNINPNDVSTITVLKDAAAASIWGARAGNGVIVITTKNGSQQSRSTLGYSGNVTIGAKPDLFYNQNFLPPAEAVELERTLYSMGMFSKNDWTAFTPAVELLFAKDEGKLTSTELGEGLASLKANDVRKEAQRYLYRNSLTQQHAVNINGHTASGGYYISAGLIDAQANLVGDASKRVTFMAKNDMSIGKRVSLSSSINYMNGRVQNNGVGLAALAPNGKSTIYTYAALRGVDGLSLPLVRNNRFTYTDNASEAGLLDWHYRPLDELRLNDHSIRSQDVRINSSMLYSFFRSWKLDARYQFQHIGGNERTYYDQNSYYARNLINQFTQPNGTTPIPPGGILDRSNSNFLSHYGRLQLSVDERFSDDHELNGILGFELRDEHRKSGMADRLYGYDDGLLTHFQNVNYESSYSLRPRGASRILNLNRPGRQLTDRFVSYYGNLSYRYLDRYVLSASARWDASNLFGVDFNQKGVPLWSVGTAWLINEEPFFNIASVSLLKLRTTFGYNGNVVSSLSSLPFVQYGSRNAITGLPFARLMSVGNPDLSWESVGTVNVALDFRMFGNRISGSFEWYEKNGQNLIGTDIFDPTTGIIWVDNFFNMDNMRNYASINTKGFDVELNTVNVDKAVNWQTTFLINFSRNTVSDYNVYGTPVITSFLGNSGIPVVKGASRDQLYALPWNGLDQTGAPQVRVGDELGTDYVGYFNGLTHQDLIKKGVSVPPYFGSIRNTFMWRGLGIGFNILWKAGHHFRRNSISYSALYGTSQSTHIDYLKRWMKPGDELLTQVPAMPTSANLRRDQAYIFSEAIFEDASHVRLQDVQLTYQLPARYTNHLGVSSIALQGYANNLGILWKKTSQSLDPDVRSMYPAVREITFGVQIQL